MQQKLALNGDDIPVTNKRHNLGEESRETSEERTYSGADRAVSEESSVTQNGDCVPEEKRELEKANAKEDDLKDESLRLGKSKEVTENGKVQENDEKSSGNLESKMKKEIKEEMVIKEENCDDLESVNKQKHIKEENAILGLASPWDGINIKKEEDVEETKSIEDMTKEKSPSPPKELPPIYDGSSCLPDIDMFELVVTSVEQLRSLIQKFGDLPEGAGSGSNSNSTSSTGNGTAAEEEKSSSKRTKVSFLVKHRYMSLCERQLSCVRVMLFTQSYIMLYVV